MHVLRSQSKTNFFELQDGGDKPAGRNGDLPGADAESIRVVDDVNSLGQILVVVQGFSNSHHDNIGRLHAGSAAHLHDLSHNLGRRKLADKAIEAAHTEGTAELTSDLSGKAQRPSRFFWNENGFDGMLVLKLP